MGTSPSRHAATPLPTLREVPPLAEVDAVAAAIRQRAVPQGPNHPLEDLEGLAWQAGIEVVERRLAGSEGGTRGVLTPALRTRLLAAIDPEPEGGWAAITSGERAHLRRRRLRFSLAHEIGHSLFYESGPPARRLAANSAAQEAFCDRFAEALLLPPEVAARTKPSAQAILSLANYYDVSLETAVRAVARHQPQRSFALLYAPSESSQPNAQWVSPMKPQRAQWWRSAELQRRWRMAVEGEYRWTSAGPQGLIGRMTILPAREQILVITEPNLATDRRPR